MIIRQIFIDDANKKERSRHVSGFIGGIKMTLLGDKRYPKVFEIFLSIFGDG